jgi:uncharacterized protein (UPF0332 family)
VSRSANGKAPLAAMLAKARRSLTAAESHLERGEYEFASGRAYYAVFHAMQAALLTKGLTFAKHSGVISAFAQHFLKTDLLPREFGPMVQRLRRDRETGEYSYLESITRAEAKQDCADAAKIVAAVEHLLRLVAGGPA